jgi:protease-4
VPTLGQKFRQTRIRLANRLRARQTLQPYIVVELDGEIVELPQPSPELPAPFSFLQRFIHLPLPQGPTSITRLRNTFERLTLDPRVKGVVLKINCVADAATYQSLRKIISDFRTNGKRVVGYAEGFGAFQYYLACACDQIVMPPSAEWNVLGFANEYVFFKDALERVGVGVDVINVSPFKSAGDQLARNDFSDESRAQAEWLLEARYNELVHGISEGRKLSEWQVRKLIDTAPFSAKQASENGLIDAALYEDELEHFLEPSASQTPSTIRRSAEFFKQIDKISKPIARRLKEKMHVDENESRVWIPLGDVYNKLLSPIYEWSDKSVAVVEVEGLIVRGNSRKSPVPLPLFGGATSGSTSVMQTLRRVEKNDNVAAVILFVDSQGGDALASDLIAREVKRIAHKKPVVAYMGGVAASGGYYVSALANEIVAQPLTVTGSIGVIVTKPHVQGVYDKLSLHRRVLQRGARANLFTDVAPLDEPTREVITDTMRRVYDDFKRTVSEGRGMANNDALENICGGRVWMGNQAKERGLVDALGGFDLALERARALAGLPNDKKTSWAVYSPTKWVELPRAFPIAQPTQWLEDMRSLLLGARTWMISMWQSEKTS